LAQQQQQKLDMARTETPLESQRFSNIVYKKSNYPFENLFEHGATQGVLKWWGEKDNKLTRSIGYTSGTLQALDEYFRHDYVKMAVPFCPSRGTDLQHQPLSSWPDNALALGWKKYQH
jgi:hypothetical protein